MKKILLNGIILLFSISLLAQSPNYFNYQSVIRDNSGELIKNQNVSFRISIISGTETGPDVYQESHSVESNDFGLCNLKIGNGTDQTGVFNLIDWGINNYYLKIELDENAGTDYTEMGTIQLLSVPYSLYANTANRAKFIDNPVLYFTESDTLFAVRDRDGNVVFAVYPDGVEIYVNEAVKGKVGGFAVSGRTSTKAGEEKYFVVTADSTRIYINDTLTTKGKVGGFAVSGRTSTKGVSRKFMDMTRDNYFIGHESGQNNIDGLFNAFMGYQSGQANTTGSLNAFYGYQAGYSNTEGNYNTFIGDSTGYSNTDGDYNTFIGFGAGTKNTTGINNSFLGSFCGYNNTSGSSNTFSGLESGYSNTIGNYNYYSGYQAGYESDSGSYNVFIGYETGFANDTGSYNVFIGNSAGTSNTTGSYNVFLGYNSGYSNQSGKSNVFIGNETGIDNDIGWGNVFIGWRAGMSNTDGVTNVFIGRLAGWKNSSGFMNTFIGDNSGASNTSGYGNVFVGIGAGGVTTTGDDNTYLGKNSGRLNSTGGNNVCIGQSAGYNETGSHKLYIENTSATSSSTLIYGEFDNDWVRINNALGIGRNPVSNALEVEGTASKTTAGDWAAHSDKRIKTDIRDIENSFETILKLRPVKFKYTDYWKSKHSSVKDQYYYNFIAQEYKEVFPESVKGSGEYIEGDSNEILQLDSYNAQIVTIKAVQELIRENKLLKEKLEKHEKQNIELSKRLEIVEERLNKN